MPAKKVTKRDDGFGREAARVVILRGSDMTPRGRREIAAWLRRQAKFLENHGDEMASRFTARWLYGR